MIRLRNRGTSLARVNSLQSQGAHDFMEGHIPLSRDFLSPGSMAVQPKLPEQFFLQLTFAQVFARAYRQGQGLPGSSGESVQLLSNLLVHLVVSRYLC